MARSAVLISDYRTGVYLGLALTVAGAYLLWDAYEARGRSRPFLMRLTGVIT